MIHNLFYFSHLGMGGTEQFLYEIVKKYSKDYDIVIVYKEGNIEQIERLMKYVELIQYKPGVKIECERAFFNYTIDIIDDIICDDIYMVNHANHRAINYNPPVHPRIKKCIAVSEFTKGIYLKDYDIPTEVSYNPITIEEYEKPLILMSAFRGNDPTRGINRCKVLAEHLDSYSREHGKRYLWVIFSWKPSIEIESPNVMILPPRADVRAYMQLADWGVSLPDDMETYGYTNVEFLMYGKPLVITPLSVCKELKIDETMSVVLDFDMKNVDEVVGKIFSSKLKPKFTPPEDRWNEILKKGKRTKKVSNLKMIEVVATSMSFDRSIPINDLGRIAKPGERFKTTADRLDVLSGNNRYGLKFVEKV